MGKNIEVEKEYILVRFDFVSLCTKIPMDEVIEVIECITDSQTSILVRTYLKSTYFIYRGHIYEKIHRVAMGSHYL